MRVLITGATGSLGRVLIREARDAGHDVRALYRSPQPPPGQGMHDWVRGDLVSGEGIQKAVSGVDAVIHAASDPKHPESVDVAGTEHLAGAMRQAGVGHLAYVSIVGVDRIPYKYYRRKHDAERLIQSSGVPYSIVRATQFHAFVEHLLTEAARLPGLILVPGGFRCQSVDTGEVARRLIRNLNDGPLGTIFDFSGPEVLSVSDMARSWATARGHRKRIVRIALPGRLAAAFRAGGNISHGTERGFIRRVDWVNR